MDTKQPDMNEHVEAEEQQQDTSEQDVVEAAVVAPEEESAKAQLMRVSADFANYKRRVEKERAQWIQTGQSSVIVSFLAVVDDIERALQATPATNDEEHEGVRQAREGFALIEKNMRKVLDELGVKEVPSSGAFDPHYHEALMQTASDEHESGHIVQVLSKGYTYKDAVIRHAKVSVAT